MEACKETKDIIKHSVKNAVYLAIWTEASMHLLTLREGLSAENYGMTK